MALLMSGRNSLGGRPLLGFVSKLSRRLVSCTCLLDVFNASEISFVDQPARTIFMMATLLAAYTALADMATLG
jgi:hypothetical protein